MFSYSAATLYFTESYMEAARKALDADALTFEQFIELQKIWSRSTFGSAHERGPVGPLRHLEKEIPEMLTAWEKAEDARLAIYAGSMTAGEKGQKYAAWRDARREFLEELVDGLFLVFDAAWRASHDSTDIRAMLGAKLKKNMARSWPTGVDPTKPVEHDRTLDEPAVEGD